MLGQERPFHAILSGSQQMFETMPDAALLGAPFSSLI